MNNIEQIENCVGCRLCEKICPNSSITMVYDNEGFLVPKVDINSCLNCGICLKECCQNKNEKLSKIRKVYAARLKNDEVNLEKSTSGGTFYALAKYVLKNKGVVFGAVYDENLKVKHSMIDKVEELYKLQGSKYVQSDPLNTYELTKEYLNKGIIVLYSGTPCQITALKRYLNKDYSNLVTVDLLCFGVPSPGLFGSYIKWLENKYKCKIKKYTFRKCYWGLLYRSEIEDVNSNKKLLSPNDPYMLGFLKRKTHRKCCYNCKYNSEYRVGDITLGDYWGIEKISPKLLDGNGISRIFINTIKGEEIFNIVGKEMNVYYSADSCEKSLFEKEEVNYLEERKNIYDGYEKDNYFDTKLRLSINFKNRVFGMFPHKFQLKVKRILAKIR